MNQKRNRLQVMHDILKAVQQKNGRIKPTHIMYKANLSHQMLNEYLAELLSKGFLEEANEDNKRTYSLTPKGFEFLSKYSMIKDFMGTFGLE